MWDYKEIIEFYDRFPPVGLGPMVQGNLQKYVVFKWLYAFFDEADASNMPSFGPMSAHLKKYEMQNEIKIVRGFAHCAVCVGELFRAPYGAKMRTRL